ncbi:MAG: hypothetical protein ABI613_03295, partial [Gemmatimonadota bacterium]
AAWQVMHSSTGRVAAGYRALDQSARERMDEDMNRYFTGYLTPEGTVSWPREALIIVARRS